MVASICLPEERTVVGGGNSRQMGLEIGVWGR